MRSALTIYDNYSEVRIYPGLQRGSVNLFNRTGMSNRRFLDRVDRHLLR